MLVLVAFCLDTFALLDDMLSMYLQQVCIVVASPSFMESGSFQTVKGPEESLDIEEYLAILPESKNHLDNSDCCGIIIVKGGLYFPYHDGSYALILISKAYSLEEIVKKLTLHHFFIKQVRHGQHFEIEIGGHRFKREPNETAIFLAACFALKEDEGHWQNILSMLT